MIYVHVPFCRSFCIYCDFFSVAVPKCSGKQAGEQAGLFGRYAELVVNEASVRADEILDAVNIHGSPDTLYVGGGTPSVLPFNVLERMVSGIGSALGRGTPFKYDEFTLEVNPDDIVENGPGYLAGLRSTGVNRISMGVQSFDDGMLRWMNRRHDSAEALKAFGMLRDAGFRNVSIDLIFGIDGMTMEMWEKTVDRAVALAPEHISAYQLSIEEGSALGRLASEGKYREADENQCRAQYDMLCAKLSAAGYEHYEISNFALPGFRAVHNSAYWERLPYTGLGAGAHSACISGGLLNIRRWAVDDIEGYMSGKSGGMEYLSQENIETEQIMLGLRTADGVSEEILPPAVVNDLVAEGSLGHSRLPGRLRIPEDRFFISDEIIRSLT